MSRRYFTSRPLLLAGAALGLLAIMLCLYVPLKWYWQNQSAEQTARSTPTMTVFVHGTFGSLLGFLSFSDVLNDRISGSLYRAATKKMRMDDFFFKDQPILDRGLKRVRPTMDLAEAGNKKYAAFPLAKAYETIAKAVHPDQEHDLFYTFGWTGSMSQQSRRFEAIRFYNALQEELAQLAKDGMYPRIRLVAHSHGGNLCLNLAAVQMALQAGTFDQKHVFSSDPDEQESVEKMSALFTELTTQEIAKTRVDQKVYDYVPQKNSLVIDQLIMLGTPIQPETESFCYAPIFKTVYNLYSDEDVVQKIDWVTSKKALSSARITKKPPLSLVKAGRMARVVQARIIAHEQAAKTKQASLEEEQSVFTQLLAGKNIFVRNSADPTHKELWFFSWDDVPQTVALPIAPLPILVLLPMITKALNQQAFTNALVRLEQTESTFSVVASETKKNLSATVSMPRTTLNTLREQARAWAPNDPHGKLEFEAVYKHVIG
ncbi:hypothetical protein EBZ39_13485 [bacterium]|nr:hypothetical protein [bacterium]